MRRKQKIIHSKSARHTHKAGKRFGKGKKRGLVCLYGELGAGKTTFVRGLAEGLGLTSRVQSPTFTYQRVHTGKGKDGVRLYHFDCYRIPEKSADPLILQEIEDAMSNSDGLIVIEWSERIAPHLPEKRTDIFFEYAPGEASDTRIIRVHEEEDPNQSL